MNSKDSTHINTLQAVIAALNELADAKSAAVTAVSREVVGADGYDADKHARAVFEFVGVCRALDVVQDMRAAAGSAAA